MAKKAKNVPKYYWDSCVFLSLIEGTPDRIDSITDLLDMAAKSEIEIWTSVFSIGEVAFAKQEKDNKALEPAVQDRIEKLWSDGPFKLVEVHRDIMSTAQAMVRAAMGNGIRLTAPDAVHIATAKSHGLTTIHTYDDFRNKIPQLNGLFGVTLCVPPKPAQPKLFSEIAAIAAPATTPVVAACDDPPQDEPSNGAEETTAGTPSGEAEPVAADTGASPVRSDEHAVASEEAVAEDIVFQEDEEKPVVVSDDDSDYPPEEFVETPIISDEPKAAPLAPIVIATSSEEPETAAATPPIVVTVAAGPAVELPVLDDSDNGVTAELVDGRGTVEQPSPDPIAVAAETRPAVISLPVETPPDEVAGDSPPPESELA